MIFESACASIFLSQFSYLTKQISYNDILFNHSSSFFVSVTYALLCILEKRWKERGSETWRTSNGFTLDIAIKFKPCLSMSPISIVACHKFIPCNLYILNSHAILKGIFFHIPSNNRCYRNNAWTIYINGMPVYF